MSGPIPSIPTRILQSLARNRMPLLLILNKADHYTSTERQLLLTSLEQRTQWLLDLRWITTCSARPAAG